jgi:hypothetical protein
MPWNAGWYLFPADLVHLIMSTAFDSDLDLMSVFLVVQYYPFKI